MRMTHLESKVGERMGNSGLGLIPTACVEKDGDARRWLAIINSGNLESR